MSHQIWIEQDARKTYETTFQLQARTHTNQNPKRIHRINELFL